jgi:hypothetical protein
MDSEWCCDALRERAEYRCPDHDDPFDCPDNIVVGRPGERFGLPVHDGGTSSIKIAFCPWCGSALERS